MKVTELSTSPEDSEGCTAGEVVEPDNQLNCDLLNVGLGYYVEEEEDEEPFRSSMLQQLVSTRFEPICGDSEGERGSCGRDSKEFRVESFSKAFKTLVDIVTEPIVDESPLSSSSYSDSSDEESFALIPTIRKFSTNLVRQTTEFFKSDTPDLISLRSDVCEYPRVEPDSSLSKSKECEVIDLEELPDEGGDSQQVEEGPPPPDRPKDWSINELTRWF